LRGVRDTGAASPPWSRVGVDQVAGFHVFANFRDGGAQRAEERRTHLLELARMSPNGRVTEATVRAWRQSADNGRRPGHRPRWPTVKLRTPILFTLVLGREVQRRSLPDVEAEQLRDKTLEAVDELDLYMRRKPYGGAFAEDLRQRLDALVGDVEILAARTEPRICQDCGPWFVPTPSRGSLRYCSEACARVGAPTTLKARRTAA
jgi:hypothetical protein